MLLNGKADVALVAWPVMEPRIAVLHLTHDILLAVLPENHAFRGHAEIHAADLRHEQIIGSKYQYPAILKDTVPAREPKPPLYSYRFDLPERIPAPSRNDSRLEINAVGLLRLVPICRHNPPPQPFSFRSQAP